MENWRLGYAVVPPQLARRMANFNQVTMTCVPSFVQEAGRACLEHEEEILPAVRETWRGRAAAASSALAAAGFRFVAPAAGIYVFATHTRLSDAEAFIRALLESDGIAVAAGTGFGPYERFLRICLNQPEDVLSECIRKMGAALAAGA